MVKEKEVLDAKSIQSIVARLSHEIVEKNHDSTELTLVGIQTRGGPLAKRIQALIHKHSGVKVSLGLVDITFHRDDFRDRLVVPQVKGTDLPDSIDDRIVILVDDVLYTGRTVRAAIEVLLSYGRPGKIQLGVLVDRGHREMPIKADFVGKNIPTQDGEHVEVLLKEVDGKDSAELRFYERDS
jgi:pyrimidine operon attenuation protein/uracil phosphoribosyltransferase